MGAETLYTAIFIWEGDKYEDGDTKGTEDEESEDVVIERDCVTLRVKSWLENEF
jgi:hypothetical protein